MATTQQDWSKARFRCTAAPSDGRMFIVGRDYPGVNGYHQPALIDEQGHHRVIGHDLRFMTQRPCRDSNGALVETTVSGGTSCLYARFEPA